MSDPRGQVPAEVCRAMRLCTCDPLLGGMIVRGGSDQVEALVAAWSALLPNGACVRRLPVNVREDQLDRGLDIAAALARQVRRERSGLLDTTDLLIVPMADRLSPMIAVRIAAAMDRGMLVLALTGGDGSIASVLRDRLAFGFDLDGPEPAASRSNPGAVDPDQALSTLSEAAVAFGIGSARGDRLALRAARAAMRLDGRGHLNEGDLAEAVRLVFLPRAIRVPPGADAPAEPQPADPGGIEQSGGSGELAERVLAAAAAAIDPALLAAITEGPARRGEARAMRGPGERRRNPARGRPIGARLGDPRRGGRLALIETLRAAAPWQHLRGRKDRLLVRKADLHVHRREARAETAVIFAVDASGSAAAARLAEAKGAVELLLGQAYVQRAEVALTAFRGTCAELLLPPTRSLTRARRALADLPGGGGTPLADGIGVATGAALAVRARGRTPTIVILSDGRANLATGGIAAGRAAAERDALAAARMLHAERLAAVFVDTSARPRPEGARLADAMGARYVPLPFAGAAGVKAVVEAFQASAS